MPPLRHPRCPCERFARDLPWGSDYLCPSQVMAALRGRAELRYLHIGPLDACERDCWARAGGFAFHPPPG
eukprot:88926-Alexandrium_andersonii.AAC.1